MTEDNRRPGDPSYDDEPTRPLAPQPAQSGQPAQAGQSNQSGQPGQPGQPAAGHHPSAAEDTRRFDEPPIWQGAPFAQPPAATAPPRERGRKRLVAGVLVAALVVGGAAGVGGAAAYDALNGDSPSSTRTAPTEFEATKTSVVEDGTVESVSEAVLPSVVKVNVVGQQGAGSGSGIVLSDDGEILTNNHVVEGAEDGGISVSFSDGSTARATVVGTDPLVDVAVIKAEGVSDLTPASIGKSGDLKVGQAVVAIGSPFGLAATVTSGIVSALDRPVSVGTSQQEQDPFGQQQGQSAPQSTTYPAIQTDAAINPGNSGGPLVDMSGRVVGINSSIRTASDASGGQAGSIGLGFAIPIDEVLPIVNQIVAGETPTHARLGVSVGEPQTTVENPTPGALVSEVVPGGSADEAGIQEGDVITKVDDHVIDGADSLVATIRGHRPGDEVTLTYERDGQTGTATADLGSDEGQSTS